MNTLMSQIDFYLTDEIIQIVSLVRLFDMNLTMMMMFVLGSGRGSSNDAIWRTTLAAAATIVLRDDETTTTIETAMHSGRNHYVTTVVLVVNPHNG